MGIASYSGASSVIKPGVVTTATRPSSPFVGQLIYDTTVSQTLAWNGSAWVVQTGGLVFITSASPSAVASVSVNNCFTSTYTNYRVLFSPTAISAAADVTMRLRAGGTDTNTNYKYQTTESIGGTLYPTADIVGTDEWYMGRIDTPIAMAMSADIYNPQNTNKTGLNCVSVFLTSSTITTAQTISGFQNTATQFDGFTLIFGGVSFSGTIRVYGYANS